MDELADLRNDPSSEATREHLDLTLASGESLLVAKAARLATEFSLPELADPLAKAFDRFMDSEDKGCLAKAAVAAALIELEIDNVPLFLRGLRHVQYEGSYGGQQDVAAELRAHCAVGLANSGHGDAVVELVRLLVDPENPPRIAAARGIGAVGGLEAEPVLRLKLLAGDEEPEVLTECCLGLLRLSPRRSLPFMEELLADKEEIRREAVILALGESRLPEAVPLLRGQWEHTFDRGLRRAILLGLVSSRSDPALEFLFDLVAEGDRLAAAEAISALAVLRHNDKIHRQAKDAVEKSRFAKDLRQTLRREFR